MENQKVQDALKTLVGEELKSVSYKWLARHFQIPVNIAKQHLFAFSEEHRSKVHTTYFLAGWTMEDEKKHLFQLVEGTRLQECKQQLDPVTSLHVYSVQPSQPKDPSDVWNADHQQLLELYTAMVERGEENCLSKNTISAINCEAVKRDPTAAKRAAAPAAAPVSKPGGLAARIDGVMAGATGAEQGVASASIALESKDAAAGTTAAAGPASAPAAAKGKPAKRPDTAPKGPVMEMFKKAPAKKRKKPEGAGSQVDDAGAEQEASRLMPEEDGNAEAARSKPGLAAGFQSDSDSDDEEAQPQRGKRRGRPLSKPVAKRALLVEDSDSEMEASMPQPEAPTAGAAAASQSPSATWLRALSQGRTTKEPPTKKRGSMQKQQRTVTYINDKGEEVTEVVPETAEEGKQPEGGGEAGGAAQPGPASEMPMAGTAKAATKKAPPARKPSPPKMVKKSGKAKPTGVGQKSLTSFFKKK